jgi:ribosomal protein L40E
MHFSGASGNTSAMAQTHDTVPCRNCGTSLPPEARFCLRCGSRLAHADTPEPSVEPSLYARRPHAPANVAMTLREARSRATGADSAPLLAGLAAIALLLAIVLFAAGTEIAGPVLLGISLALLGVVFSSLTREPGSRVRREMSSHADRVRWLTRRATVSARVWSRTGVDVVRIRRREHRLRSELEHRLKPLGEAVHEGDQQRAEALKSQASVLARRRRESELEASALLDAARAEVGRERAPVAPTEVLTGRRAGEDP